MIRSASSRVVSGCVASPRFVVDQPQALARTEPGVTCPRLLGVEVIRPDIGIEQPHGGIEMRQVCALLSKLLLKLTQHSCQFGSLVL